MALGLAEQAELVTKLSLRDDLSRGIRNAQRNLKGFGVNTGKIGGNLSRGLGNAVGNIERVGAIAATVAVGGLVAVVKAAADWESAFAGVRKTMDLTDAEAAGLAQSLRDMSKAIPVDATELAAIAEAAGALGVAKADVLGFTDVVAKLGVTTDLTTDAAATALGHLTTTLQLTGEGYSRLGNALVDLGNHGASTESQILGMTESVAGASKIIGLSEAQTLGWGAALANTGEEIEAGGSSLQRFFLETFKMVNKGGGNLERIAKVAGTTGGQFKKAFGEDASGALETFIVGLGNLSEAEQVATLEALGFTDIRITRSLLKLTANTDNLTDSLNTSESAWEANNAMTTEAEKRFATTDSKLQLLKNSVKDAAITVGSELLPVVADLAKQGADWLGKPEQQARIKEFAITLRDGIRDLVDKLKTVDWGSIVASLQTAAGFARGLFDAFMGAPEWLKTAVITGWGLNKLTGGAVGGIVAELGKGLIKGVLGLNTPLVQIKAGVVQTSGPVAGGTKGGGLGGALGGVGGAVTIGAVAGLALDQLGAEQKGALDAALEAHPVTPHFNKALADSGLAGAFSMFGTQSFFAPLTNFLGPNFGAELREIGDLGADAAQIKTNTDPIGSLVGTLLGGLNPGAAPDRQVAAQGGLRGATTVVPGPGFTEWMHSQTAAVSNPTTVVPGPGFTEWMHSQSAADNAVAQSAAELRATFLAQWAGIREQLGLIGKSGPEVRNAIAQGLNIAVGELVTLRHSVTGTIASELGITTGELRRLRSQSHGDDAILAAKLGITVGELQAIREKARATAANTLKISNKNFSPKVTVNTTVTTKVGITGRTIYNATSRDRIVSGGPTVE